MIVTKHRQKSWWLVAVDWRRVSVQAEVDLRTWAVAPMLCFGPFAIGLQVGPVIVSVGKAA